MSLFHKHLAKEPHHTHIQPNRLLEYAAVGAAAGAASHALGAAILKPFDTDHYNVGGAALAGLAGGAALHAGYGLLAALAKTNRTRHELQVLAASTSVSAILGGLTGAAILSHSSVEVPPPGHLVVAGILGGVVIGAGFSALRLAHCLCCCCWPEWLTVDQASEHDSIFGDEAEEQHRLARSLARAPSNQSFESA